MKLAAVVDGRFLEGDILVRSISRVIVIGSMPADVKNIAGEMKTIVTAIQGQTRKVF
jgi:hypothetical protein